MATKDCNSADVLFAYGNGVRAFRNLELSRADFRGAALGGIDFRDSSLIHADLRKADLTNANLRGILLWGSDLRGTVFDGATFRGADLSGALMAGIDLRRGLVAGANLSFCHLVEAALSGLDLRRTRLYGAHLIRAQLDGANLAGVELRRANLEAANLTEADLSAADLESANLEGAVLCSSVLDGANLRGAVLRGADLRGASLVNADLEGADLEGAILDGANVQGARIAALKGAPEDLVGTVGTPVREPGSRQPAIGVCGFARAAGEAELVSRKVLLGASAPVRAAAGEEFTARFVAHAEGLEDKVRVILTELSSSAHPRLGAGKTYWAKDAEVVVTLRVDGLEVAQSAQDFRWDGEYQFVDFDVRVPQDAAPGKRILKFDAFVAGMAAGTVRLEVSIAAEGSAERTVATQGSATTGFASYASDDRLRVLDRVSAMRQLTGIDIFLDCISLRAGERWERRLYKEIADRDLFLLFWSRAARESEWVNRELQAALTAKGEESIQVQPLDPPSEAPPPPELGHLHFNDLLTMVRSGLAGHPKTKAES